MTMESMLRIAACLGIEGGVLLCTLREAVIQGVQALLQDQHLLIQLPLPGEAHVPDAIQGCLHPALQAR